MSQLILSLIWLLFAGEIIVFSQKNGLIWSQIVVLILLANLSHRMMICFQNLKALNMVHHVYLIEYKYIEWKWLSAIEVLFGWTRNDQNAEDVASARGRYDELDGCKKIHWQVKLLSILINHERQFLFCQINDHFQAFLTRPEESEQTQLALS